MKPKTYNLTQARARFTRIVRDAQPGEANIITRYGLPVAAVVSVAEQQVQRPPVIPNAGTLSLRGTGRGLWSSDAAKVVAKLRDELDT